MYITSLLGSILLLICLIPQSYSQSDDQAILINYQISQLKTQIKEYQQEKQDILEKENAHSEKEASENKSDELLEQLDQAKAELQHFMNEKYLPYEQSCQDEQTCEENNVELLKTKKEFDLRITSLEKKLSLVLNAGKEDDQRNAEKQNQFEENQKRIQELNGQINLLEKQITEKKALLAKQKEEAAPVKVVLEEKEEVKAEVKEIKKEVVVTKVEIKKDQADIQKPVSTQLVRKVKSKPINIPVALPKRRKTLIPTELRITVEKEAKIQAQLDAQSDIQDMVEKIGLKQGRQDGERDGHDHGLKLAIESSYQRGLKRGLHDGQVLATIEGHKIGKEKGHQQSLEEKAKDEAEKQAQFDVEESNVIDLAKRKGERLGRDKAHKEGFSIGRARGEAHAIDKFENRSLTPIQVNGPFIGAFSPQTPVYNEDYCQQNPCHNFSATLDNIVNTYIDPQLQRIFKNTYTQEYQRVHRQSFLARIDSIYLKSYSAQFNAAVEYHAKQHQQKSYQEGLADGIQEGKDSYQKLYEAEAKKSSYLQGLGADHSANKKYQKLYRKFYRQFKQQYWNKAFNTASEQTELRAYQERIESEIIKAKTIRFAEVSDYYEQSPVLSFRYAGMKEIGIDGIGAGDGIFQPGEGLSHDIIISNHGLEEARNIEIIADDNHRYQIPKIPASTKMHFKGIAKSIIPENFNGESFSPTIEVFHHNTIPSPLTINHLEDPKRNLLGGKVHSALNVEYPLKLELAQWKMNYILGEQKEVSFKMTNISKKPIAGTMELTVNSNTDENIPNGTNMVLNLAPGEFIEGSFPLSFNNEQDLYRNLYVEAKAQLNEIVMAKTSRLPLLIKSPSKAKDIEQNNIIFITAGDRPQPIISQLMNGAKNKFAILDSTTVNDNQKNDLSKKKSFIIVHEKEDDINPKILSRVTNNNKSSNLLVIKNSQTEVKLATATKSQLQLNLFESSPITLVLHREENGLLPVLVVQPEMAQKAVALSQYLAKSLSITSLDHLKSDAQAIDQFALKLLLRLLGQNNKKLLNEVHPSLTEVLTPILASPITNLDGTYLSQVYLKLKNDLQNAISLKIESEDNNNTPTESN